MRVSAVCERLCLVNKSSCKLIDDHPALRARLVVINRYSQLLAVSEKATVRWTIK